MGLRRFSDVRPGRGACGPRRELDRLGELGNQATENPGRVAKSNPSVQVYVPRPPDAGMARRH